jgi:ABC-type branched-subunit amino acid transport system permease subunit
MSLAGEVAERFAAPVRPRFSETHAALCAFLLLALVPVFFSGYSVYILPQYMLYGMLALSLSLLWGGVGLVSFGQAGFFMLGAYAIGLAAKLEGSVNPAYIGIVAAVIAGGVLAGATGYFLFSADVRGFYFVLVTLTISIMAEQIAVSQSEITGGYNGMFIPRIALTLGSLGSLELASDVAIYYTVFAVTALSYAALRLLLASRFGAVLAGIRENEDRAISLGFRTSLYKTVAFTISGALAALAGALYGTHAQFVSPSLGGVGFSTEVVVWVAIGGFRSMLGALLGAIVMASLSNYLSAVAPDYWQLMLGVIFIVVIGLFQGGTAGAIERAVAARL